MTWRRIVEGLAAAWSGKTPHDPLLYAAEQAWQAKQQAEAAERAAAVRRGKREAIRMRGVAMDGLEVETALLGMWRATYAAERAAVDTEHGQEDRQGAT